MDVSPARAQFLAAISHIRDAWVNGCHCRVCICVDRRFPTLVSVREKADGDSS